MTWGLLKAAYHLSAAVALVALVSGAALVSWGDAGRDRDRREEEGAAARGLRVRLADAEAALRRREAELLAARVELDAWRRNGVWVPAKPDADVRAGDRIPKQSLPTRAVE